jgi:hypothetical protein
VPALAGAIRRERNTPVFFFAGFKDEHDDEGEAPGESGPFFPGLRFASPWAEVFNRFAVDTNLPLLQSESCFCRYPRVALRFTLG